jgi:hypothetical protein
MATTIAPPTAMRRRLVMEERFALAAGGIGLAL